MKGSVYISYIFALAISLLPLNLQAQELDEEVKSETMGQGEHAFIIDGQIRARGEYRNGAIQPRKEGQNSAAFVNERARLSLGYASNGVQLQFSGQHAGVWGDQSISGTSNGFSVNEAWGQVNTNNRLFAARVGRQALSYDNGRILGSNDWTATGNFHNALRLSYEDEWNKVHVLGAFNQSEERISGYFYNDSTGLYKNMQALWYHFGNESFPVQASVLLMNIGRESGTEKEHSIKYLQTGGAYITYESPRLGASLEGYYQIGKEVDGKQTNAWMAAVNVRYTFLDQLTAKVGYDMLSGSKRNAEKNSSFCPFYSSFHQFHGAMDYFASSYLQPGHSGLSDAHAEVVWSPAVTGLTVSGAYHFLSTSYDQIQLSHEIDLQANWRFKKDVTLTVGYSCALNTKNMNYLLGGSNKAWQDFAFIQLNIAPRLLFLRW